MRLCCRFVNGHSFSDKILPTVADAEQQGQQAGKPAPTTTQSEAVGESLSPSLSPLSQWAIASAFVCAAAGTVALAFTASRHRNNSSGRANVGMLTGRVTGGGRSWIQNTEGTPLLAMAVGVGSGDKSIASL